MVPIPRSGEREKRSEEENADNAGRKEKEGGSGIRGENANKIKSPLVLKIIMSSLFLSYNIISIFGINLMVSLEI